MKATKTTLAATVAATFAAAASEAPHWGYGKDDGPARWAAMHPEWSTCSRGLRQSPIDIRNTVATESSLPATRIAGGATMAIVRQEHVFDALDNGHTIQVNVDAGDKLMLGETTYDLLQFHFHAPSEHAVDGRRYAMEMHLVHSSPDGDLAVVGVFIDKGDHNPAFDTIWQNLPTEPGEIRHLEDVAMNIDQALPADRSDWRYEGSLTTPPCTEGVRWIVMQQPIAFDADQIARFEAVFSGNNRPLQPLNGRKVSGEILTVD